MGIELGAAGGPKPMNKDLLKKVEEVPATRAGAFLKNLILKGIDFSEFTDGEAKEALSKTRFMPGVTADDVMNELRKLKVLLPDSARNKPVAPAAPVRVETEYQTLSGIKQTDDENLKKEAQTNLQREEEVKARRQISYEKRQIEEKKHIEELEKDVFKNPGDLDAVHEQALALGGKENSIEKPEYYDGFTDLVERGQTEIQEDLQKLAERLEDFKIKNAALSPEGAKQQEKHKKIATIVERGIAYSVTELGWYSQNIKIGSTSQFDDVKRGVDDMMEINKKDAESKYLGLGMDVTYTGLESEKYKEKIFSVLHTIENGQKTKIKYYTNQKGEKMKEFAVPKIILHFDAEDVKELVHFVKNSSDEKIREEFKNNPMKIKVLNQIMIQCELLAEFAEECGNDISEKYLEIANSIGELGAKNKDIQEMLANRHDDATTERIRALIIEFKQYESEIRMAA